MITIKLKTTPEEIRAEIEKIKPDMAGVEIETTPNQITIKGLDNTQEDTLKSKFDNKLEVIKK